MSELLTKSRCGFLIMAFALFGCSSSDDSSTYRGYHSASTVAGGPAQPVVVATSGAWGHPTQSLSQTRYANGQPVSAPVHDVRAAAKIAYSRIRVRPDYMPRGARGRTGKSMRPRYITIHSTQNWSRGADAWRHSLALKRSKLGKLSWHYTVDENVAVQHLPTSEQGRHADMDGPGNHYSIGIEMCEHPGNSRRVTLDRTARLTAWLMYRHNIPLSRVVPHYHWPRWGHNPPNKNCPHFLLDHGRPGRKWRSYLAQVKKYHDEITGPRNSTWAAR